MSKVKFIFYKGESKFEITLPDPKRTAKKLCRSGEKTVKAGIRLAGKVYECIDDAFAGIKGISDGIKREIREDITAVRMRDPAARGDIEVLLLNSGVHAILAYRVAHKLYIGKKYFSARAVSQLAKFVTGIEIHPGAQIGHGFFIDHGTGVVIGETCEIGDNCTLYQGVTLGGTGKDTGKRHPTLGNNVMVGAGAKVLGPFKIGDNTKIAAGAVVLNEIPENCTAVGIPAKIVKRDGIKVDTDEVITEELDQIHVPDPVGQQFAELESKISALTEEVEALKARKRKTARTAPAPETAETGDSGTID